MNAPKRITWLTGKPMVERVVQAEYAAIVALERDATPEEVDAWRFPSEAKESE